MIVRLIRILSSWRERRRARRAAKAAAWNAQSHRPLTADDIRRIETWCHRPYCPPNCPGCGE